MSHDPSHPSSAVDLTGQLVGEYEVLRRIGVGGMGEVYEGRHPLIGKRVAVKVLLPSLSHDPTIIERFLREAQAVNAIRHPGIVDIFSFGKLANGAAYCVMEYLDGEPLGSYLGRNGRLPIDEALALMAALLETLAAAHRAGIVHRDIKPSNLFLHADGRGHFTLKVLDFGIAKMLQRGSELTQAQEMLGTPEYMAPEQITGQPVSAATDLYAAGVLLFRMLTGSRPFNGQHEFEVLRAQVHDPPPVPSWQRPELFPALDAFVLRLLAKDPTQRFASAEVALAQVHELARMAAGPGATSGFGREELATNRLPATLTPVRPPPPQPPQTTPALPPPPEAALGEAMQTAIVAPPSNIAELMTDVRPERGARKPLTLALQLAGLGAVLGGVWWAYRQRPPDPLVVVLPAAPAAPAPAALDAGEPERPADTAAPPPAGEVAPPPVVDAGAPLPPPPPLRTARQGPTREALLRRLAKAESTLKVREERVGQPDRLARGFVASVRATVANAKTDAQLLEAAADLRELEAQLTVP